MYNALKKLAVSVVAGSVMCLPGDIAQVRKRSICGRVVLNPKYAVTKTEVVLNYPGIELDPGVITNRDGTFCIENFVIDLNEKRAARLYVMSFCRPDDVRLTAPPFWPVLRKEKRFAGKDIIINQGELTRLGDVDVQMIYGHVSLKILDWRHQPFLTQLSDWSPVWIRVRDQNGVRVHESGLSPAQIERSVHLRASEIDLALPTGMWTLEVALDGVPPETDTARRAVKWLRAPSKLKVDSCDKPVDVVLSVPRNTRSPRSKS